MDLNSMADRVMNHRHGVEDMVAALVAGGSAIFSFAAAIDANAVAAWVGAICAVGAMVWGTVRAQIRLDREQRRREQYEDAIQAAKIKAIADGKIDVFKLPVVPEEPPK